MKTTCRKSGRVVYTGITQGRAKRIIRNAAKRLKKRGVRCSITSDRLDLCSKVYDYTYSKKNNRIVAYFW